MTDSLKYLSWGLLVAPLAFFYFYFIDWAFKTGALPPTGTVETVIMSTMVLRLLVIMSVKRLRRGRIWVVIDIFALEIIFTAVLLILYIFTRVPLYFTILAAVTQAWPSALMLVIPAFALYRFGLAVVGRGRLSLVLPGAVSLFVLLLIPAEAAARAPAFEVQTLSSISHLMLQVLLGFGSRQGALMPEVTLSGLLLYLGLTFYVITTGDAGQSRAGSLALAIGGSVIALGWTEVGAYVTDDLFFLFVIPGLVILGLIWGATRGRR